MRLLRRHRLAYLSADAWSAVRARPWDVEARECLDHWAAQQLPLVVTRQSTLEIGADAGIALGLPAPGQWGRRRLRLQVPREAILFFGEFPRAAEVSTLLARAARPAWRALVAALEACDAPTHVYGSHGWQRLSGLRYLRHGSDLDVWIAVADADHADAVVSRLEKFAAQAPRLDGELVFRDGSAVHWREWMAWRAGTTRSLLVKHVTGAAMAGEDFMRAAARRTEWAA